MKGTSGPRGRRLGNPKGEGVSDFRILGGYGTTSTPIEPALSHYVSGFVRGPNIPNIPWNVITNGALSLAGEGSSILLGRATIPVIPYMHEIPSALEMFILGDKDASPMPGIHTMEYYLRGFKEIKSTQFDDLEVKAGIESVTPEYGFLGTRTPWGLYISADRDWLMEQISYIQQAFTYIVQTVRSVYPRLKAVGYGAFEEAQDRKLHLRADGRPGMKVGFGTSYTTADNVAEFNIMTDPFTTTQMRSQAMYLYALAYGLNEFLGDGIYSNIHDHAALANSMLYQFKGAGDINIKSNYTAYDVMDTILHYIGTGISQANPYLPRPNDAEAWWRYIKLCVILGLVAARTNATVAEAEIIRLKGLYTTALDRFKMYTRPQLDAFGGSANPYYLMPYNVPHEELYLPVLVDETEKRLNQYRINKQMVRKFETVDVRHGETEGQVFDPLNETERFIRPVTHTDVRIRNVRYIQRELMIWEIPTVLIAQSNINGVMEAKTDDLYRRIKLVIQMLSNAGATLKDGYLTQFKGLDHFITGVYAYTNSLGELTLRIGQKDFAQVPGQMSVTQDHLPAPVPGPKPVVSKPEDAIPITPRHESEVPTEKPVTPTAEEVKH